MILVDDEPQLLLERVAGAFTGRDRLDVFGLDEEEDDQGTLPDFWEDGDWLTVERPESQAKRQEPREAIDVNFQTEKQTTKSRDLLTGIGAPAVLQTQLEKTFDADAWMDKYSNGKIPLDALDNVDGFGLVRPDGAVALRALIRDAKREGHDLTGGAYRDFAGQVAVAAEKPDLAAVPGTSNHGWGVAIDISNLDYDTPAYQWLMKHGPKYGWVNPEWAQAGGSKEEPWHWEFQGWDGAKVDAFRRTVQKPKPKPKRKNLGKDLEEDDFVTPDTFSDPVFKRTRLAMELLSALTADEEDEDFGEDEGRSLHDQPGGPRKKLPRAKLLKQLPQEFRRAFQVAAKKTGLPLGLLIQVASQETGGGDPGAIYNPDGPNSAGAVGPMQVIPKWHPQYKNLDNAKANIIAGAQILLSYIGSTGSIRDGLAAYNAGPNNMQAGYGYADEILNRWRGGN